MIARLSSWFGRRMRPPASGSPSRSAADPERSDWDLLLELLPPLLALPPDGRARFLEDATIGAAGLREELEQLVAAHERTSILDRPPAPITALPPSPAAVPSLARTAPHYELLEKIGGGGMGVVYRARDRRLGRFVALKFLPAHLSTDAMAKERFLVEARAAAALDHPNICTIFEAGEADDGQLFLAMPFYAGETLKQHLRDGPLPVEAALGIALQIGAGLAQAHACGIVHRDIKPANLMITTDGVVKIVDFGVAKLAGASSEYPSRDAAGDAGMTRTGIAIGTLAYMSPEQAQAGETDARTDLWSLGAVLYEMLAGVRPFRGGDDRALIEAITSAEPVRITTLHPELPTAVEEAVLRALAKRSRDRFVSAGEMTGALEAARAALRPLPAPPFVGPTSESRHAGAGDTPSAGVIAEGERRHATVLVAMLHGYDTLVEQLVPAELERLLDRVRMVAADVAERHGGLLNHFAGDQMVLLFGAPVTREDDAVRAARAALALIAGTRVLAADAALDDDALALHAGLHTGTVITRPAGEDGQTFRLSGSVPAAAVRLAEHSGTGECWLSAESRSLVEPFFELAEREPITLRSRAQPLAPYALLRESGAATRIAAAGPTGLTAFTGRDAELDVLRTRIREVQQGAGRLVLVTGEAGVGKSRLVHELAADLARARLVVLSGRCQTFGAGVPYLPFIDVLRGSLAVSGVDASAARARLLSISAELDEFVPLYLHLLGIRSTAYPVPVHLQGDAFRLAMQEALAALFTVHAGVRPVALLLEDWHWADDASHAVLGQLAELLPRHALLVIVTARPGYGMDRDAPPNARPLRLRPLATQDTAAMLRAVLHADRVAPDLLELVRERSGGNPFFIEEICNALRARGALCAEQGALALADSVHVLELPDSIQGLIRARLDRLPREARDLLRLAAVVGREFPCDVLEAANDAEAFPAVLDVLRAAGLVERSGASARAYRFRHVLTQEVAYASLLEHQRRELHGRVGTVLEQLHGDRSDDHVDRLAHHFTRAELWPRAVQYGLRAAERARRLAQYAEALQVLEGTRTASERLADATTRKAAVVDVLLQQERLCETLGQRARQQRLIDELIALLNAPEDRPAMAEVLLRQGDLLTLLKRYPEADEPLQRSLQLRRALGDAVGERNTIRSLGLLRWHEGRNLEALALAEAALCISRARDDRPAIVGDLANCGAILRALGEHERARVVLEEALATQPPSDGSDPGEEVAVKHVYALHTLANLYRQAGDMARALECLERGGALAAQKQLPMALAYHYTSIAHLHLQEGRIEESVARYRDAIQLTRRARCASGLAQSLRIFGAVLVGLGRHEGALPHLYEAATTFAHLRDPEGEAAAWSAIGAAEEHLQSYSAALSAWSRSALLLRKLDDRAAELAALEGLARTTRLHVPEPALALACYERAVQLAETLGEEQAEGRMRNVMGILEWNRGEHGRALGHYERAFSLFEHLEDDAHAGLMLNGMAATLRALGRSSEAESRLNEALTLHRRSGQVQLEGHALGLLGEIHLERSEVESGTECFTRSLAIRDRTGDRRGAGWMRHGLARCALASAAPFRVREHLDAAAAIAEEVDDAELADTCRQLRRIADF